MDNIMGPEVSLGLNVNLDLDRSSQDAATLADQIKQMRMDQEAFRDVIADTQDRLREITSEYQEQLSLRQQMVEAEQSLRNISDSRTDSLRDQVNAYQDMEQSMSRLAQTMQGMGQMPYGMSGMGGMSGFMGGMMGGYYNPMSGMMSNFGGFPSAFSGTPEQEEAVAEEMMMKEEEKGAVDRARQAAQDFFYFTKLPQDVGEAYKSIGSGFNKASLIFPRIRGVSAAWNKWGKVFSGLGGKTTESATNTLHIDGVGDLPADLVDDTTSIGSIAAGGGVLSSAMRFAGPVGMALSAGLMAYKVGSDIVRTGQEYGTLTGSDSPIGGYGSNIQSFMGSFMNPLMPSGVSKQIEATGLASGYGFGSNYLNQYRSFASGAYERFGMNPQESQQLFQAAVVQAGESLGSLSNALQATANNAANVGVSFAQAQQNLLTGTQIYSGLGVGNPASAAAAMTMGLTANNQQLGQILGPVTGSIMQYGGSLIGQALTAQAAGVPITGLYNWASSHGGVGGANYAMAELGGLQRMLSNTNNPFTEQMLLGSLGIEMTQQQATAFTQMLEKDPGAIKAAMSGSIKRPELSDYTRADRDSSRGFYTNQSAYNAAMKKYNDEQKALKYSNLLQGTQSGNGVNVNGVTIELGNKAKAAGFIVKAESFAGNIVGLGSSALQSATLGIL